MLINDPTHGSIDMPIQNPDTSSPNRDGNTASGHWNSKSLQRESTLIAGMFRLQIMSQ